jgi:hypothetical protein
VTARVRHGYSVSNWTSLTSLWLLELWLKV